MRYKSASLTTMVDVLRCLDILYRGIDLYSGSPVADKLIYTRTPAAQHCTFIITTPTCMKPTPPPVIT